MSHHFAPEFTVLPTNKEPVSKKLQRNTEKSHSAKKRETEQLHFDNQQLEWKLSQLRQVMSKEKEDRGKQGSIWKSGNARIESHSRNILGRTISGNANVNGRQKASPKSVSTLSPKSPTRVKVLKDEPLDLPERDSLSKDLIRRLTNNAPVPEDTRKKVEPVRQLEHWIKFSPEKDSPDVFDIQSNLQGNLELSAIKAINASAIGVYFMKWGRKRLLIAAEGVIRKPKAGWGDEIYYPYTVKSQIDVPMRPEPPSNKPVIILPQPPNKQQNGGLLLEGDFDEEKNAASFQQALMEWRSGKLSEENSPTKEADNLTRSGQRAAPEMSVHVAQCTPEPFDVKFSETSTLSYMERVLLQKHRQSEVPPLPRSLTDTVNEYLDPSYKDASVEGNALTTEEEEERERYRQLFSPWKSPEPVNLIGGVQFIEVDSDDGDHDVTDTCIVDESPPATPPLSSARSSITVKIEEVTYDANQNIQQTKHNSVDGSQNSQSTSSHEYKENYDPITTMKSPSQENLDTARSDKMNVLKISNVNHGVSQSHDFKLTSLENGHYESGISHRDTAILHEIGKLPINPDAFYNKGLDVFFVMDKHDNGNAVESQFYNFEGQQTLTQLRKSWNPLESMPDKNDNSFVLKSSPESDASNSVMDSKQSTTVDSDGLVNRRHLSAKNSGHYDINSESDDSADERALDDLEWELASQMGNITADGRISRLIDEWPEEGDLDIIDDPGSGSGLTTPDVNSNHPSRLNTPYIDDVQMQYEFHNMEHVMMDDLNDEYSGDEV